MAFWSTILRLPLLGRFALVRDAGGAAEGFPGGLAFRSNLRVAHLRGGKLIKERDFGSGLVTTAGVNYMAADFLSGSTARINAFNQQDSGTGTVAAAVGDTALGTAAGPARVAGTQTNPTANQYRSVATVAYTATLAITEWGLFSATTAGTLWDRKVFTAINVVNGDSIQFTYTLTVTAGG